MNGRRHALVIGLGAALLLLPLSARADEPAPNSPADKAMQLAVKAGRDGDWSAAVAALDRTVSLAPSWSDAYYMRGWAYVELAGADVGQAALATATVGHDYKVGAERLAHAISDLETYLKLQPDSNQHEVVEKLVASYEERRRQVLVAQDVVDMQLAAARGRSVTVKVAGWSALIGGFALIAGGIAESVAASQGKAHISAGGFGTGADIDSAALSIKTQQELSYAAYSIGGASVVLGLGCLIFGPSSPPPAQKTGLRVQGGAIVW